MSVAASSSERIDGDENVWTRRLVLFLRIMAVLSVIKGLYHWAQVTGFVGGEDDAFENQSMAWQTATVYFAVIELVAAVGLWLATPWGAVVWLTTVVSMAVIELMFPGIYGGSLLVVAVRSHHARPPISRSHGWRRANGRHSELSSRRDIATRIRCEVQMLIELECRVSSAVRELASFVKLFRLSCGNFSSHR